jgi:hypothetical protein
VGAVTVLLTVLLNVFATALGLTPEAVTQISTAIIAAGLAIIGGIALDNHSEAGAGKTPPAAVLLLALLVALGAVGCTQPFERSQQVQIQVMKQLRDEMDNFRSLALAQMRTDKGALIDMAFRWDLQDASKDGQVPLQFVLSKDAERKAKIATAEASISTLNRDFEARWALFSKGISLGEATYDVLSQWTRTGKALEGVFTTLPEVHAAAEKAMAPTPEPSAASLPALESAVTEPPIAKPQTP